MTTTNDFDFAVGTIENRSPNGYAGQGSRSWCLRCSWRSAEGTRRDVLAEVREHARAAHGIPDARGRQPAPGETERLLPSSEPRARQAAYRHPRREG